MGVHVLDDVAGHLSPAGDCRIWSRLTMLVRMQWLTQDRFSRRKRTASIFPSIEDEVDAHMSPVQRHDGAAGVAEREPEVPVGFPTPNHPCSK